MIHHKKRRRSFLFTLFKESFLFFLAITFLAIAFFLVWIATLDIPDFSNFENRAIANSTKIYDRSGKIVLYDVYHNVRRTAVPITEVSPFVQKAVVAIEDASFYEHKGFRPLSFLRALYVNITSAGYSQGGSTITQQVVKNALLTREKKLSRKAKEIILAVKLEKSVSKEKILEIYLNESPYGGTIYGVEEASVAFFGKKAKDVSLVEAAYLAALPQSPTFYSPYGQNRAALEKRKNLVLSRMKLVGFISEEEMTLAQNTFTEFLPLRGKESVGLHFVFYVREYLEEKYGKDLILNGGLRVITTLDYELQRDLEALVKKQAFEKLLPNNATNASLVLTDSQTGEILAMVGSRDFFDTQIPGQFNITVAKRQPGSSFKPIVYALAFEKGYTPETVLFDVPTQFSALCDAYGKPNPGVKETACYMPENYDQTFRGPVSLRNSLAQSLNIPAVKLLYLVGLNDSMSFAQKIGLSSINDAARFGLSLVLGGGEVSLLSLVNAYSTFASRGEYKNPLSVLSVSQISGSVLEENKPVLSFAFSENTANTISDILSDNNARAPLYGSNSPLHFEGRPVAVKTGTTNDYRDLWVIGYTPEITLGMWAGNNDNTPIQKKVSGQLLGPIWREAMNIALAKKPVSYFKEPLPNTSKEAILRGEYCEYPSIESILGIVTKGNPSLPLTRAPESDPQYELWQTSIDDYLMKNPLCGRYYNNTTTTTVEILPTVFSENTISQ